MWKEILRKNFKDIKKLSYFLNLDLDPFVSHPFPLNLPLRLAEKIEKKNPDDPILRQFLPTKEEEKITSGFLLDPVGDLKAQKETKLLHKYQGRALILTTGACAMHCRFCFRKNYEYDTENKLFDEELEILRKDSSITEVILSGGDPLSLSNQILEGLIDNLSKIPHIQRLRFHTRFPIGIPERIDTAFLNLLEKTRLQVVFVIHCNHPKELDADIFSALKKIQRLGIPILNSAVLLKGVNDSVEVLKDLFNALSDHGILPYYLNQLDKVQGAAHFEVSQQKGLKLMAELSKVLSGYAVPKYVKEIPGQSSKTSINP